MPLPTKVCLVPKLLENDEYEFEGKNIQRGRISLQNFEEFPMPYIYGKHVEEWRELSVRIPRHGSVEEHIRTLEESKYVLLLLVTMPRWGREADDYFATFGSAKFSYQVSDVKKKDNGEYVPFFEGTKILAGGVEIPNTFEVLALSPCERYYLFSYRATKERNWVHYKKIRDQSVADAFYEQAFANPTFVPESVKTQ